MATQIDPLQNGGVTPERVAYAIGLLLGADDFTAEQLYHRSRLARIVSYLHGSGTVAGLEVRLGGSLAAAGDTSVPGGSDPLLVIMPGMAIDRLGRVVELSGPVCIRLDRWVAQQDMATLRARQNDTLPTIADVFVRFAVCEQGLTPSFLTNPFDALGGVAPSRLRDGYEASLLLRTDVTDPTASLPLAAWPAAGWPDLHNASAADLHRAIFAAWRGDAARDENGNLTHLQEHMATQDPTDLFLARVRLQLDLSGSAPALAGGATPTINNDARLFVYPLGALLRWLAVP